VGGSLASDGDTLVFLTAGSADCAGAIHCTGSAVLSAGAVTIRIDVVGRYKLCIARQSHPTLDAHFSYVAGVLLVVSHAPPPSPPLPPPPSSPLLSLYDPDAAMTYIIMAIVIAGEVSSFDEVLFKSRLSEELAGVSPADISLDVSSASTRVVITVSMADPSVAAAVLSALTALAASTASLSAALDVDVLVIEAAPTLRLPLSSPPSVASAGAAGSNLMPIIWGSAGGATVLLGLIVGCATKCKARRTKTANAGFTSVVVTSTSSAATNMPTTNSEQLGTAAQVTNRVHESEPIPIPHNATPDMDRTYTVAPLDGAGAVARSPSNRPQSVDESIWQPASADLEWGEVLGSGSFGDVYKVSHGINTMAAKRKDIRNAATRQAIEDDIKREIKALHKLTHRNIVQLVGAVLDDPSYVAVLMELADAGSLRQVLESTPARIVHNSELQTSLALDIASGLAYCHAQQPKPLLHHDIKSANVLLFSDVHALGLTAKLADFGLAVGVSGSSTLRSLGSTTANATGGTFAYRAPETFSNTYTMASEVYSFAVLLWELLSGIKPWNEDGNGNLFYETSVMRLVVDKAKRPDMVSPFKLKKADPLATLMRKCWSQKPSHRPTFEDIVKTLGGMPSVLARRSSSSSSIAEPSTRRSAAYASDPPKESAVVTDNSKRLDVGLRTLDKEPSLLIKGKDLAQAEQAVCERQPGARAKLAAQLKSLQAEQRRLRDERTSKFREKSAFRQQVYEVIDEGKACQDLYESAFKMLMRSEPAHAMEEYNRAAERMQAKVLQPDQCVQAIGDLAGLYEEAVATRMPARDILERLSAKAEVKLKAKVKLHEMGSLKRMSRASEKIVLSPPDGKGGAEKICDIVRDMFEAETMADVAKVLDLLRECEDIEILRFKNRFVHDSGGWRDAMINYRLKGSRHVCEAQISHRKMIIQRKGMGGHEDYACERNAREVLEFLGEKAP